MEAFKIKVLMSLSGVDVISLVLSKTISARSMFELALKIFAVMFSCVTSDTDSLSGVTPEIFTSNASLNMALWITGERMLESALFSNHK